MLHDRQLVPSAARGLHRRAMSDPVIGRAISTGSNRVPQLGMACEYMCQHLVDIQILSSDRFI